ncbi:DUF6471 domain-containing protein [Herbaspirillum camelliae]|uniref:DUF6471 domain-containing protein n=1 Tax=Herbaspirillum camelliae TaxID=1892903 RepID=UPI00117AB296|nr:DUF6471 domain-containing protein [Herbaspirillum camelliae]
MNISWKNLATRAVKGVLAIKDVKPSQLQALLLNINVKTRENAVAEMISKDAVSLVTFIQILVATKYVAPALWDKPLKAGGSWEARTVKLLNAELDASPLSLDELLPMTTRFNAGYSEATLRRHIETGAISLADFFVVLYCLRSDSARNFLQQVDIDAAAKGRKSSPT